MGAGVDVGNAVGTPCGVAGRLRRDGRLRCHARYGSECVLHPGVDRRIQVDIFTTCDSDYGNGNQQNE